MSSYTGAVNMSGTDASIIADLIQQLADTKLELSEEKDEKEKFKRKFRDAKDEIKELKEREIDEDDAYAINVPSGYGEKIQDNGVDGDEYHAKIQALEKTQEFQSEANRAKYGLAVCQMDVKHQVWEHTKHLVFENRQLREDKKVLSENYKALSEVNKVVKEERDLYKGGMAREREARQKKEHGVESGRVTKNKGKTARHAGALADNISLTLRQKEGDGRT